MSFLSLLTKSKELTCCAVKPHDIDPIVNVAHKFNSMFSTHLLGDDQFLTSLSYQKQMEQQARLFNELANNNAYWSFISNKNRVSFSSLHYSVEDFIKFGIPPDIRGKMWPALAGVSITPELVAKYRELSATKHETYAHLIEKDVERTFEITDPSFFDKLSRVLTAYSNHNPAIGYCQSMNILTATLLIFMPEEYAFRMLIYIIEELVPNFHCETMSGYQEAVEIFKFLIAAELPELHIHFQNIHFDISAIITKWFLSLFVHAMPHVTAFLVWDNILMKGKNAIFEVGLAILRMQQTELLQIDNYEETMEYIPRRLKELYNPSKLLKQMIPLRCEQVQIAIAAIARMAEEVPRAEEALKSRYTGAIFTTQELNDLWIQYVARSPVLCCKDTGLNFGLFSEFVAGTFGAWYLDAEHTTRLFHLLDLNHDGVVDFPEIVCLLYVVCKGPFEDLTNFALRLYDTEGKGWMSKKDLTFMLRSMFGMFDKDKKFIIDTDRYANDIFAFPDIKASGQVTKDNFREVALVQDEILTRFKKRNSTSHFHPKSTLFYWIALSLSPRSTFSHSHPHFHSHAPSSSNFIQIIFKIQVGAPILSL